MKPSVKIKLESPSMIESYKMQKNTSKLSGEMKDLNKK
jgi:hypothetical protein